MKSKYLLSICISVMSLVLFLTQTSCSATKTTAQAEQAKKTRQLRQTAANTGGSMEKGVDPQKQGMQNLDLADMLRRVPGVNVNGNGMNATVRVRGISSINSGTDPLYVVDGVPLGTSFTGLATTLNPNDIKRIRLVSGADASIYGVRGANGVIVITRKN